MSCLTPGPDTFPPRNLDHSVRLDISLSSAGGPLWTLVATYWPTASSG